MKALPAPTHSLDPADWFMYCDLLQDANAPEETWGRARRIAESLSRDPKLVLINYCPEEPLRNHWLRVGQTWFIGAAGTLIETNRLVWWRVEWARQGFERYPSRQPSRDIPALIALNYGLPWDLPHPRFHLLREAKTYPELEPLFWDAHALSEIPAEYL